MNQDKIALALDTEFECSDLGGVTTPRKYLKELLTTLLDLGESFSGKRPFGNSGWQNALATPLILAGAIEGDIDEDGYAEPANDLEYCDALAALVEAL